MGKVKDIIKEKKLTWVDAVVGLLLGTVVIAGILCVARTIWSGYHFLDDHELLRLEKAAEQRQPLFTTMKSWIINDLGWRFRPLYWVERVTAGYLFGSNLTAWNIWTAFKGILAFALLYEAARFLRHDRLISAIFPMVIMLGTQFTPWYRSANQESTGVLLCAAALCLIAAQYYHKVYKKAIYNVPIFVFVVLSGLVKESFTLFMPVFPALKLWLEYWDGCDESWARTRRKGRFLRLLKENAATYGVIPFAMLVNIYMILFKVGVDHVSYAGFHQETGLMQYLQGIQASLLDYMRWDTLIAGVLLFMVLLCYQLIERYNIWKYLSLCLIMFGAMGVQLVAHAKSGMWERYMFPYVIAYAVIFVLLGYRIFHKDIFRSKVYLAVLLVLLCNTIPTAARSARDYAKTGEWVAEYFECIVDNTGAEDRIVAAFGDEELDLATECWLETHGRSQVFSNINGEWKDIVQLSDVLQGDYSWKNVKAVTCYNYAQVYTLSLMEDGASEDDFDTYTFGNYMVMVRK